MLAFRDGDPAGDDSRSIRAHLDSCDDCRLELHRLQYALGKREEMVPDRRMLAQMRSAIEQFEASTAAARSAGADARERVAEKIAPFLGNTATTNILQPVPESGDNLLSSIEPILALFLGGKAASRLVTHVVDSALIRA